MGIPLQQSSLSSSAPSGAANLVEATPNGSSGAASLRALVVADLPTSIPNANLTNTSTTVNGDGTVLSATGVGLTLGSSGTLALKTQTINTVLAGPTSGGAVAPTFRTLVAADVPTLPYSQISGTPAIPTSFVWNVEGNATGNLTLSNATFTSTFNQTVAAAWLWTNTTTGSNITTNASPLLELAAQYWTGAASATDLWTIGSSLAAGTNGASTLTFTHTGSTGSSVVNLGTSILFCNTGIGNTSNIVAAIYGTFHYAYGSSSALLCYDGGVYSIKIQSGAGSGVGVVALGSAAEIAFSSTTTGGGANDTSISRSAVGVVAIGTGAQGSTAGALAVTKVLMTASAGAPTSAGTAGTAGQIIYFGGLAYLCSVTGIAGSATWNKLSMVAV